MRITFLITQDIESPSGVRYFALARELARLGHAVTILALHPDFASLPVKEFIQAGVRVRYTSQMHVRKKGSQKTYFRPLELALVILRAAWGLASSALRTPSDIYWIGKPHPMNSVAGILARLRYRSRLFLDCDDYEQASGRFQNRSQRFIVAFFERNMPRWVDAVTTNTLFMKAKIIAWRNSPERIYYLPNGVDQDRFNRQVSQQETAELKESLGLSGRRVVGFIGSLSLINHPVNLLIQAFRSVHEALPNARLLLTGGGEDMEEITSFIREIGLEDAVIMTGRVQPENIPVYYRLADVLVDPVYDDDAARGRCPLKLFESWSCGVPFVTGNVGDRMELAGEPQALLLAQPGNVDDLAKEIFRVLSDHQLAQDLACRGLERSSQYAWGVLVKRLNDFLL